MILSPVISLQRSFASATIEICICGKPLAIVDTTNTKRRSEDFGVFVVW